MSVGPYGPGGVLVNFEGGGRGGVPKVFSRKDPGHLVVPNTEELISQPFLDKNSIRQLF